MSLNVLGDHRKKPNDLNVMGDRPGAEEVVEKTKNSMEMAFIPKGSRDSRDYKSYVVRVFKSVPIKSTLICENIFTGKAAVKKSGLRFIAPWYRSKLVYVGDTQIDYPTYKLLSNDGIQMAVDYTLNLRIINPIKFEFSNQDTLLALNQLTENLMRVFVANHNSDDLFRKSFSLKDIDPNGKFKEFSEKYGLSCTGILFKCDIPKSLKDDYEKRKEQEKENERREMEAKSRLRVAKIDAETKEIEARAEASANAIKLSSWLKALRANGVLSEGELKTLQAKLFSEGNAQLIANFGSDDMSRIQSGILSALRERDRINAQANAQTNSQSSNPVKRK